MEDPPFSLHPAGEHGFGDGHNLFVISIRICFERELIG